MQLTIRRLLVALVLLASYPNIALAQTDIYAGPNPFYRYDGIDVTAWLYSDYDPQYWCHTYESCYYTGYASIEVSGSDGFYAFRESYGQEPSIDVYGWDSTPGQNMQSATYWAHGGVYWTVTWCIFGCSEEPYWDDTGWDSATVNPDPCFPFPSGEVSDFIYWAGSPATLAAFWMTLDNPEPSFSMAGRRLIETDGGGGVDTCWYPGGPFTNPSDHLSGGTWFVQSGDSWGFDHVGWRDDPPNDGITQYRNLDHHDLMVRCSARRPIHAITHDAPRLVRLLYR